MTAIFKQLDRLRGSLPEPARSYLGDRRGLAVVGLILAAALMLFGLDLAHWLDDRWDQHRVGGHDVLIEQHAREVGLPVALVRSVVTAESGGDPRAVSNRNARGLMQITPITEKDVLQRNPELRRGDLFDPEYNLTVGTRYLAHLLDRFEGDIPLALAAYHMGPTNVRKIQKTHPGISTDKLIEEHAGPKTRAYVRIVTENM